VPLDAALELEVFQGPLDLLLTLIERRRLEITAVSLAAVAEQYLQAVRALPQADAELLAEFLVIASRLLLLKSRALLPREEEPGEEDEDDGADLVTRLEAYRAIKQAAEQLAERLQAGYEAFGRPAQAELAEVQPELEPVDAQVLAQLWRTILRRVPKAPVEPPPLTPRVQVGERLEVIRTLLARRAEIAWSEIAGSSLDEMIATFLAILELIRRIEAIVRQDQPFGEIILRRPQAAGTSRA
jgi:segregation and condensation protein A